MYQSKSLYLPTAKQQKEKAARFEAIAISTARIDARMIELAAEMQEFQARAAARASR
jgi:hypothetical protein